MFLCDLTHIKKFLDCDMMNTIAAVLKMIVQNCIEKGFQSQAIRAQQLNN